MRGTQFVPMEFHQFDETLYCQVGNLQQVASFLWMFRIPSHLESHKYHKRNYTKEENKLFTRKLFQSNK